MLIMTITTIIKEQDTFPTQTWGLGGWGVAMILRDSTTSRVRWFCRLPGRLTHKLTVALFSGLRLRGTDKF